MTFDTLHANSAVAAQGGRGGLGGAGNHGGKGAAVVLAAMVEPVDQAICSTQRPAERPPTHRVTIDIFNPPEPVVTQVTVAGVAKAVPAATVESAAPAGTAVQLTEGVFMCREGRSPCRPTLSLVTRRPVVRGTSEASGVPVDPAAAVVTAVLLGGLDQAVLIRRE